MSLFCADIFQQFLSILTKMHKCKWFLFCLHTLFWGININNTMTVANHNVLDGCYWVVLHSSTIWPTIVKQATLNLYESATHRHKLLLGPGAQAPPTFMITGLAYMMSPPPTFVTWYSLNCVSIVRTGFTQCQQIDRQCIPWSELKMG